ncbi:MAG: hypothetical protein A2521_17390 [Deltaproteobacteria bacterium RIFOXYD12_FULL_57_12]|nr:MAG: hypothetical protein A2521_17390 [Deltaproteobacteria bacterium RIFOXYD12_FULL_57_12]
MIKLTKTDGRELLLNPDLIEIVEEAPDTHITLNNGHRYLVLESAMEIREKIIFFRAEIQQKISGVIPFSEPG